MTFTIGLGNTQAHHQFPPEIGKIKADSSYVFGVLGELIQEGEHLFGEEEGIEGAFFPKQDLKIGGQSRNGGSAIKFSGVEAGIIHQKVRGWHGLIGIFRGQ